MNLLFAALGATGALTTIAAAFAIGMNPVFALIIYAAFVWSLAAGEWLACAYRSGR